MLKRLLGILLIVCMLPIVGLAAETENEANAAFDTRIEKLAYLGITFDEGIKHDESVTRVNFIRTLLDFAKAGKDNSDCGFYDVDIDHPYFDVINAGANLGYMKGYENGYFYPDKIITVDEAVKVLVCALGYEVKASSRGGFPEGYTRIAEDLGVLDGVKRTEPFTYDAFAKLLENALDAQVLEMEFGADKPRPVEIEGHDALWVFHKMTKVKAVVTANAITGLKSASDKTDDKQYAKLDGEMVYTGDYDISQHLGYSVEAYLYHDKSEDYAEVKYAELSARNATTIVDAENILDTDSAFSAYNFVYTDEKGKTKKVEIDGNTAVIYNGIAKPGYSKSDLMMDMGNVTIIDNNGDGDADCISIFKPNIIMVVDYVAKDDNGIKVFDLKDQNISYLYDADNENYVVYIDGEANDASAIESKMAVLIGTNGSHSITKAYSSKVEGTIKSVRIDGNDNAVTIDDVEYKVATGAASAYQFKLNAAGTFFVDDNFYVYGYDKASNAGVRQYGYFLAGYSDKFETVAAIELLTTENEIKKIFLREKLTYNSVSKEMFDVIDDLKNDDPIRGYNHRVVMYELDDEGKIKALYTPVDATRNQKGELRYEGMFDRATQGTNEYAFYKSSWQNKFWQDSETIMFNVNISDLEASYVSGPLPSQPITDATYKHYFYNIDENLNTVDVVVWERGGTATAGTTIDKEQKPTIVTSVAETINEYDETVKILECVQNGKKIQIMYNDKAVQSVKDAFNAAQPGDIIYYAYDGMGRLSNMYIALPIAKVREGNYYGESWMDATWKQGVGTGVHIDRRSTFWHLTKKLQNNFFVYTDYDDSDNVQKMNTAAGVYKLTVKGSKARVETITYGDVQNGSDIFTQSSNGTLETMIVIEIN